MTASERIREERERRARLALLRAGERMDQLRDMTGPMPAPVPDGLLRPVSQAAAAAREVPEEFRRAVVRARDAGAPVSAIAEAAGVTRQRIYQILKEEK